MDVCEIKRLVLEYNASPVFVVRVYVICVVRGFVICDVIGFVIFLLIFLLMFAKSIVFS